MRIILPCFGLLVLTTCCATNPVNADWPWRKLEGTPRVDVIGPLGNRLPYSYSRKYNRPSYLGGKMATILEPSSQEAIAFERADAAGLYDNNGIKGAIHGKHCPPQRVEQHYFYPKPWEVLQVGPRVRTRNIDAELSEPVGTLPLEPMELPAPEPEPQPEPVPTASEVQELRAPVIVAPLPGPAS